MTLFRPAWHYRGGMPASLEDWWPRIPQEARDWLIANNGDAVPASVAEEITRAGGSVATDPAGHYLSDEAVDWIEAVANGETPHSPGGD